MMDKKDNKIKSQKNQKSRKAVNLFTLLISSLVVLILLSSFLFKVVLHTEPKTDTTEEIAKANPEDALQISILNGSGVPKLADQTRNFMRARGFDIVEIGNFSETAEHSYIIDRCGDKLAAKRAAQSVGIRDSLIVTEIDSSLYLKCSVILGRDYKKLRPFN